VTSTLATGIFVLGSLGGGRHPERDSQCSSLTV
jgi:hypothetical protein